MAARRPTRDLAPTGPVGILDRAVELAREGGADVLAPAWLGGGVLAAVVVGVYYLERIEGITTLRLPAALLLVLAWWARAYLVGRASRAVVGALWDAHAEPDAGRPVDVLRTAVVVGLGLWVWSWLLVLGSLAGPVGVLLVVPLFALRGAVAPSWLARAACSARAGWRGLYAAFGDSGGQRFAGIVSEAFLLGAAVALVANLFGVLIFGAVLARAFGGFELSAIESFVSPENTFVVLVVAAVALVALEPVRAAHAACVFVGARVRAEGLDLRATIDTAIRHSNEKRSRGAPAAAKVAAAVALALGALAGPPAQAQPPGWEPPPDLEDYLTEDAPYSSEALPELPTDPGPIDPIVLTPEDLAVQADVDAILARAEFREFADQRGAGLRELFDRLLEWLGRPREELTRAGGPRLPAIPLPGAWAFLAIGLALLAGIGAYLFVTRRRAAEAEAQASVEAAASADIRDRAPRSFLDEASALAEQGNLREALRALYLATLVALDRRRLIAFDPHLTNWQYLRQMPRGAVREAFSQFTRVFDHKWYGREDTSHDEYERCRDLARRIVEPEASA
ncbi:MAG: DUF4129 domain-containing protein [Sandaracinaceae bacterium]|nr:DUF4129 domain-containing protein [Sandaracinaceae bacterium]